MELWIGQVVDTSHLSTSFCSGLENYTPHFAMEGEPSFWLIGDDGLPIEYKFKIHGKIPTVKLDKKIASRQLAVNARHIERGILILGVELSLNSESQSLYLGQGNLYLAHVCFNITEISLANSGQTQARINEVTELLRERNLPNDRVGLIVSGPLS